MTAPDTTTLGASLVATTTVALVLAFAPVLVMRRLLSGALTIGAADVLLVVFAVCWVQLGLALLRRDDALESLTQSRLSMRWQADHLVAQSLFGCGAAPHTSDAAVELARVQPAAVSVEALLPPPARLPAATFDTNTFDHDAPARLVPTTDASEPDDEVDVLATEEYEVARGDTFWSIAEYAFGDGRKWRVVQRLNLGREVAPGIILDESHQPRIGWSILIPLVTDAASPTGQAS